MNNENAKKISHPKSVAARETYFTMTIFLCQNLPCSYQSYICHSLDYSRAKFSLSYTLDSRFFVDIFVSQNFWCPHSQARVIFFSLEHFCKQRFAALRFGV
jgi:hypothetical protein